MWATGYVKDDGGRVRPANESENHWKHGAGGYKSNVEDFARWALALVNDELLSERARRLMVTPQKLNDGSKTGWGLGISLRRLRLSHGGSQSETRTVMVVYPEEDHGIVVMCNAQFADPNGFVTTVYAALRDGG